MIQQDDLFTMLFKRYYNEIYKYIYVHLNRNAEDAKDVTQEVFLVLMKKMHRLKLDENIRMWLYRTADNVLKEFYRKNRKYRNQVSLDSIEIPDDGGLDALELERPLETLSDEEYRLLSEYCDAEHGKRNELAKKHGLTIYELYKKIDKIKKKIKP